jgi:uncharacterized protein YpmB
VLDIIIIIIIIIIVILNLLVGPCLIYAAGRTPWTEDQPVAGPLPTQDNTNTE